MGTNKPKVLFIASNIPTPKRGSNRVVITIAEKLTEYFHIQILHPAERVPFPLSLFDKYRVIAGGKAWKDGQFYISPFKYFRLPTIQMSFLLLRFYKRKLRKFCETFGIPELTHAHFVLPDGYLAYLIKQAYNVPYIVSVRNSDLKYISRLDSGSIIFKQYMVVLKEASQIVVHNKYQYDKISENGFESCLMAHGIEKGLFVDKIFKQSEEIIITSIGQLIPQKNIGWVIDGVKDYEGAKKIKLFIAGEGILRRELELSARDLDTTFLGIISNQEIIGLLEKSSIFALPSTNETFGLVYLEATATRTAVIASKNTGIWGHFEESKEMMFCDSYESFKKELHLLIDDEEIRMKIAENAFQKAKNRYTWDTIINNYKNMYIRLLDRF